MDFMLSKGKIDLGRILTGANLPTTLSWIEGPHCSLGNPWIVTISEVWLLYEFMHLSELVNQGYGFMRHEHKRNVCEKIHKGPNSHIFRLYSAMLKSSF